MFYSRRRAYYVRSGLVLDGRFPESSSGVSLYSVSMGAIRDFRGAMVGRADKGLFITTGTFTRDARLEAQRDGAPPLDMIDGDELVIMLKELRMGIDVRVKTVEEVVVDRSWFQKI